MRYPGNKVFSVLVSILFLFTSVHGYLSLWRRTQREFAPIVTQLFFSREMARFDTSRIMARY